MSYSLINSLYMSWHAHVLTHWGRVPHICVGKTTIIGSDNGLSPDRCQAIIWTNAGILLIGLLGTYFGEIFIEIHTFSFTKMHLKMSSGKRWPFCLSLNVLTLLVLNSFQETLKIFTFGAGATVWLSPYQWINPEGCGLNRWIPVHNKWSLYITLWMYCNSRHTTGWMISDKDICRQFHSPLAQP